MSEVKNIVPIRSNREKEVSVPVTDKIGELVKAQIQLINEEFPGDSNPDRFLFLRYKGKSSFRGLQYLQPTILRQLNTFAKLFQIRDENGEIFRFKSRLFRHRFGITKINNGISIVDVQKFTANVTPIMAVTYANH